MTLTKTLALAALALMAGACSSKSGNAESSTPQGENIAQEQTVSTCNQTPEGEWKLVSYRLDCATTDFTEADNYAIAFHPEDHAFGITTDCNSIGGEYTVSADTIRFANTMVTEMACPDMTVEQNILRLINDPAVYALCQADTLTVTAPSVGTATFVRRH